MTVSTAPFGACDLRLTHAVADHLAAAELDLFAVNVFAVTCFAEPGCGCAIHDQVFFNLDNQISVRQTQFVAYGRAEHGGIVTPTDLAWHLSKPP